MNRSQGQFSLILAMFLCLLFPLQLIFNYTQTVRVLVFCHKYIVINLVGDSKPQRTLKKSA